MFHAKNNLTLQQLARIKLVKPPGAGEFWQGVQHTELVRCVSYVLSEKLSWTPELVSAIVSNDKADVALSFTLSDGAWISGRHTFDIMLAVRNSNARRWMGLTFYVGLRERNANKDQIVVARINAGRKRDGSFDLAARTLRALGDVESGLSIHYSRANRLIETLDEFHLNFHEIQKLCCICGERHILSWAHVGAVHKLFSDQIANTSALNFVRHVGRFIDRKPVVARFGQLEQKMELMTQVHHLVETAVTEKQRIRHAPWIPGIA